MNQKEVFEAMEAKEKQFEIGKSWTFSAKLIYGETTNLYTLWVGRISGTGYTPEEAMLNLHKNANDPNYEPVPF